MPSSPHSQGSCQEWAMHDTRPESSRETWCQKHVHWRPSRQPGHHPKGHRPAKNDQYELFKFRGMCMWTIMQVPVHTCDTMSHTGNSLYLYVQRCISTIYTHIYIYIYTYHLFIISSYTYTCICVYVYVYIRVYIYICMYIYMYMYICIYVYVYIYI